jgi:hypothetical protein
MLVLRLADDFWYDYYNGLINYVLSKHKVNSCKLEKGTQL